MIKDLIVIGSGNPDIIRLIENINSETKCFNFLGFIERGEALLQKEIYGYPILGGDELVSNKKFNRTAVINNVYSSQEARQRTFNQISHIEPERFCNLIHPTVKLHDNLIGVGNIIYDYVVIQNKVQIGDHNVIHSSSIISHESTLGSNCLISANVTLGSRTSIGNYCFFGIGSTLLPSISVIDFTFVGGGAVVFNNVNKKSTLFGNPARALPFK